MAVLALDYQKLVRSVRRPLRLADLGSALLEALGDRYEFEHGDCALHVFEQSDAIYLFDLGSSAGLHQEDRTVAAWTVTPQEVGRRDTMYQRGFPMATGTADAAVDRGHLIPHVAGGQFGPNLFRQDRRLNRGWSEQGKKYRSLERQAAGTPGTFYFGHLIYGDTSAYPTEIEVGLLRGAALHVERFDNRPESR